MARVVDEGGTVYRVSIFTPDESEIDTFCERQVAELSRLSGRIDSALDVKLFRARDSGSVVTIAAFESLETYHACATAISSRNSSIASSKSSARASPVFTT